MSKIFGRNKSGKVTICRAKPENRGRYNCTHTEHFSFTKEELSEGIIQKMNKGHVDKAETQTLRKNKISKQRSGEVYSNANDNYITKEELLKSSMALSKNFDTETFNFIKDFYSSIEDDLIELKHLRSKNSERIVESIENINNFLNSDNEEAERLRNFLGNIDLKNFSEILVLQVTSMTSAIKWSGRRGKSSIRRSVLTALNNDMNKNRYVASVTFFGGRCCYCNIPLQKGPPPERQASGEHLTPISPTENNVLGSTRFGNMALSCISCNKDRGNKTLENFIQTTNRIPKDEKPQVLARINNFRRFALYSDYDKKYSDKIERSIDEISKYAQEFRNPDGSFNRDIREEVRKKIKVAVYDLQVDDF